MSELALDDVQRHAYTKELERVPVTQLVRREPSAHAPRAARRAASLGQPTRATGNRTNARR